MLVVLDCYFGVGGRSCSNFLAFTVQYRRFSGKHKGHGSYIGTLAGPTVLQARIEPLGSSPGPREL